MRRQVAIASAIVLVPLLGYPIVTLARGTPRFPSSEECVRPAVDGRPVDLVFGRFDDPAEATALRERVLSVGFEGTQMLPDGCGRWKVVLLNVPSVDIAREVQAEAATVDLAPTLELGSAG
jgi:hypothetical protein